MTLRVSFCMLNKHYTNELHAYPILLYLEVLITLPTLAPILPSPCLSTLSSWDYRYTLS